MTERHPPPRSHAHCRRRRRGGAPDARSARAATRSKRTACRRSAISPTRPTFTHFNYVDPHAPKGGTFSQIGPVAAIQSEFPHLQFAQQLHPQGRRRAGHGADLRHPDGALRRRAGRHVRPCRREGAALGRRADLSLFHPAGSQIPRRHAAHRAGRRLLAQHPQGKGPSDHHAVAARFHRRRRPTTTTSVVATFAPQPRARRAAVRRRPADFLARLLREEAVRRIDARHAARLRPLQGRPLRGRPLHRIRAREGLVGRRSAGRRAARTISTSCASNIIATATSASKASPPAAICSARNSPRAPGRRATIFRRSRTAASNATSFPTRRRPARRAGSSTRGARNSRIRGCAKRCATPSISNGPTRTSCTGSYERTISVFQNSDMMAKGKPGADELALLEPFRGRVPDEVFGEPYVPPVSDGSGQDRALLRKASQLLKDAGCARQGRQARAAERRADHHRVSARRADLPAAPHAVHQESRHCSASRRRCAWSIRCNTARAATTSISTSRSTASASRPRRAIRCARISPRRRRRSRAPTISPALPIPAIDALIDTIIAAPTRPALIDRLPRARPRDPRRALLDSALVQAVALDRLLGRVRPAAGTAALFPRHSGNLVVRPRQGGENPAGG